MLRIVIWNIFLFEIGRFEIRITLSEKNTFSKDVFYLFLEHAMMDLTHTSFPKNVKLLSNAMDLRQL